VTVAEAAQVPPGVSDAVLDHGVTGAEPGPLPVVKFQPELAAQDYPVVDGIGGVHPRVVRFE